MKNGTKQLLSATALALAISLAAQPGAAQDLNTMYLRGQAVVPAYEGWMRNPDGSYDLYFGYMNLNWEQEFDIPVGESNRFEPGDVDRGQPTHFYPRRNPFLFTVNVPADFGDQELVWTVTSNGHTYKAFASLDTDYAIDPQVISTETGGDYGSLADELRTNIAPELKVESEAHHTVKVGEKLTLSAVAHDPDNIPDRRPWNGRAEDLESLYRPVGGSVVRSGPGLRLSWIVYRGPAENVTFDPTQLKTWMDTRIYSNSPWAPPYIIPEPPPENRWITNVTFSELGEYVLRAVASDGAMYTYENVRVTVNP